MTAWLGNTPKIAPGHHLQTLGTDSEKAVRGTTGGGAVAVRNPVWSGGANARQEMTEASEHLENQGCRRPLSLADILGPAVQVAKVGLEPTLPVKGNGF